MILRAFFLRKKGFVVSSRLGPADLICSAHAKQSCTPELRALHETLQGHETYMLPVSNKTFLGAEASPTDLVLCNEVLVIRNFVTDTKRCRLTRARRLGCEDGCKKQMGLLNNISYKVGV